MTKKRGIEHLIPANLFTEPVCYWWQMLTPPEWDYCVVVDWEIYPSGSVVIYE